MEKYSVYDIVRKRFFLLYFYIRRMSDCMDQILENKINTDIDVKRVVDFALEAGTVLLKYGAEIFRVEETIEHICHSFHVHKMDVFVISHGIFISADNDKQETISKVKHIPLSGANLEIVAEVNNLSRDISAGLVGLDEAFERLNQIEKIKPTNSIVQIVSAGIASSCFGYMLDASIPECVFSLFIGALVYAWVLWAGKHKVSKILVNIMGGIIITLAAVLALNTVSIPMKIDGMIIGSIMPLIPGLGFVNAIRDIANSDFLSGTVRMIDALLVFVYIAVGVGVVLGAYSNIGGLLL